jgi:proteasome lid subunit RPN8/RPN11
MLRIRKRALDKILHQAERDYPYETCGLLLGKVQGDVRTVFGAYETPNVNEERKNDRYEIDPRDYMRAEDKAREFGLEIVGVYHSHPDHPDRPSRYDEERAFEGFSYIIVSVQKGRAVSYRSWELVEGKFREEEIQVFGL